MVSIASKTLPSGAFIPSLALGVCLSPPGEVTYNAVLTALKLGYRHIDTAQAYRNEADVGRPVRDSGVPRQEVFVTSKVYPKSWSYDSIVASVKTSNEVLGLGYIDLFLLHAPGPTANRADAWRALEDMQDKGLLRDIGVSNYGEKHLEKLAQTWRKKPAVNQIELHPWLARKDTVAFCESQGILLEAYSPLAQATRMDDPVLLQVAEEADATPAQVLIAWSLAKGFITLPKSVKAHRIQENLDGAAVQLSQDQLQTLDSLDRYLVTSWDPIKNHAV